MEIPGGIVCLLSCVECGAVLSRGPVFQAHDGAALCGRCVRPHRPTSRNQVYEAVAQLLRFPCRNRELGCTETVPFTLGEDEVLHELQCPYRQYLCPVMPRDQCDWLGTRHQILDHCETQHPDKVLKNGAKLTPNIKTTNQDTYILHVFYNLFLVHVKVCVPSGKIFYSVRYLGYVDVDKAGIYIFTVDIKHGRQSITKSYSVAPPGCLAIQEDSAMMLHINSLLQVLDGFEGAEFILTVWNTEGCRKCGDELNIYEFADEDGWLCSKCRPVLENRKCNSSNDCTFTDFDLKCGKHESFFCSFAKKCPFCNDNRESLGQSLIGHYTDYHKDITFKSRSIWRNFLENGKAFLISSDDIGLVRCRFWKYKEYFRVALVSRLSNKELPEYYCEVKLINHVTKKSKTLKKYSTCSEIIDWKFDVYKTDFVYYESQFDICISINKLESE